MAIRNRKDALAAAMAQKTNAVGTCQFWTRNQYNAPSVGDVDQDNDADAVDGWKSEPEKYRHYDRTPPAGVPVAFSGGSRGFGHRCISRGSGNVRSTDMSNGQWRPGVVGNATISQIESQMNVKYLGWSESISGIFIPNPTKPKPTRGMHVDDALRSLNKARGTGTRKKLLDHAKADLTKIPFLKK